MPPMQMSIQQDGIDHPAANVDRGVAKDTGRTPVSFLEKVRFSKTPRRAASLQSGRPAGVDAVADQATGWDVTVCPLLRLDTGAPRRALTAAVVFALLSDPRVEITATGKACGD